MKLSELHEFAIRNSPTELISVPIGNKIVMVTLNTSDFATLQVSAKQEMAKMRTVTIGTPVEDVKFTTFMFPDTGAIHILQSGSNEGSPTYKYYKLIH